MAWIIPVGFILLLIAGIALAIEDKNDTKHENEQAKKEHDAVMSDCGYTSTKDIVMRLSVVGSEMVGNTGKTSTVSIDDTNKVVIFGARVVPYAQILNAELMETSFSKKNGGVTRAIVGGALAGGVGAIVGASTARETTNSVISGITIYIADVTNPQVWYCAQPEESKELYAVIQAIIAQNQQKTNA